MPVDNSLAPVINDVVPTCSSFPPAVSGVVPEVFCSLPPASGEARVRPLVQYAHKVSTVSPPRVDPGRVRIRPLVSAAGVQET